MYFNNCVEGKISECLFDTAHKKPSAKEVETLKLQLSTYNSFLLVKHKRMLIDAGAQTKVV